MNFSLIGILIRLRYKLLWAKTRSRSGKIALFFAGYLLLVMVMAFLSMGGIGAGMQAIRSGKGPLVAGIALAGIYLQGLLASVVLGFGMAAIFSDTELRRYPLKERERRLARHFIGIADPFWYLFLALDLGVALGLYLFGEGSFWLGSIAALLLLVSNYLGARVVGILVDRLMAKKAGGAVLILLAIGCAMLPQMAMRGYKNPAIAGPLKQLWTWLPPAGAAAAMTRADLTAVSGLAVVAGWLIAMAALLVVLERRPPKVQVALATKVVWAGPIDRFGALFGTRNGRLVALWLRFFSRNNRFRAVFALALPIFVLMIRQGSGNPFALSEATFSMVGIAITGRFAVNLFGYVGGGFRRCLLLPTEPAAALRAGSYLFVSLGVVLISLGAGAWCLLSRAPFDGRALIMLVGASVTSLFLFHGVAIWTAILGARRGNYQGFGNDLSFAGNATLLGGVFGLLLAGTLLAKRWPGIVSPDHWWATPPMAAAAIGLYFASLRSAAAVFRTRREQLMATVEGRG
ncbi:MAG: hypothetical protein ACLQU1_30410 [Bryobacteraceae bacterium]